MTAGHNPHAEKIRQVLALLLSATSDEELSAAKDEAARLAGVERVQNAGEKWRAMLRARWAAQGAAAGPPERHRRAQLAPWPLPAAPAPEGPSLAQRYHRLADDALRRRDYHSALIYRRQADEAARKGTPPAARC